MKVLLVDCYDTGKAGRVAFNVLNRALDSIIQSSGPLTSDIEVIIEKVNEVGEYTVDWEGEKLDSSSRQRSIRFDTLDIIVIGGDMKLCPWHPRYMKVVTLLHMAKTVKKPVLAVGAGAFAAIYSIATQGAHHILL